MKRRRKTSRDDQRKFDSSMKAKEAKRRREQDRQRDATRS